MPIYVFIETIEQQLKNGALEVLTFAHKLAETAESSVSAIVIGEIALEPLAEYGVKEVLRLGNEPLNDSAQRAEALASVLPEAPEAFILLFSHAIEANLIAAQVSVLRKAALVTGVLALEDQKSAGLRLRRSVYTGKAFETVQLQGNRHILCIQKGVIASKKVQKPSIPILREVAFSASTSTLGVRCINQRKNVQAVPLPDAKVVVSGGRGLQNPDNWGLIEALAEALGAATACSKPVSDMGWRPHHEHVGQTGLKIAPKLYIAVGISGAIQHLAGISASRYVLVINTDSEAPFFQVADYGVVGNALDFLPKLTAAVKKLCC